MWEEWVKPGPVEYDQMGEVPKTVVERKRLRVTGFVLTEGIRKTFDWVGWSTERRPSSRTSCDLIPRVGGRPMRGGSVPVEGVGRNE